jgi:hypothetical protein
MKTVKVYVSGGVIQHIELPNETRVEVYDYDVDGFDPEELDRDPEGEPCEILIWE